MVSPRYRYNPKTCKYEPAKVTASHVLSYFFSLAFATLLLFGTLLFLQYRYFPTSDELALRTENDALMKHKKILNANLSDASVVMSTLEQEDERIHEALFPNKGRNRPTDTRRADSLLLTDRDGFMLASSRAKKFANHAIEKSYHNNLYFARKIDLKADDVQFLASIPTLQPVENPNEEKLISGYGVRINPFHKGNYDHPGVDFAAPRGTLVLATADGTVVNIVRSSLEAGYGNYVDISHHNGFMTRYAHLDNINVRTGQRLTKRTAIGTLGSSGGSVAPHVHYEIFRDGKRIDPAPYMIEGLSSSGYSRLIRLAARQNQSLD